MKSNVMALIMLFVFTVSSITIQSCKKDESTPPVQKKAPSVTTSTVSSVTATRAESGGNVTDNGGAEITDRGVCWRTSPGPTTADFVTFDGTGTGSFTSSMWGLMSNTVYYVRAYATNSVGTAYGKEVSFSTTPVSVATITTNHVTSITQTMAISGGYISDDGGGTVTASGVCWNTSQNPTVADSITNEVESGSYLSYIKGLNANTVYYVRAYATNSAGTSYGEQRTFTTATSFSPIVFNSDLLYDSVTDIDENVYKTIQIGTQTWMAENLRTTRFNDGTTIPDVPEDPDWKALSTPAYCWYNNETDYTKGFGALYNWYAVNTTKLCPEGWHVPSDTEWGVLADFLGGMDPARVKIMETGTSHWQSVNTDATNISGFTAIPSGARFWDGQYTGLGTSSYFWSSKGNTESGAMTLIWDYLNEGNFESWGSNTGNESSNTGLAVRCLRN